MCDKKLPFEIFLWGLKPNHETIVASLHGGNKFLQSCPCSVHASVWRLILNLESHGWRFPIPSWLLCFDWGNNLGLPLGWLCCNFGSPLPWPPTRPLFNLVSLGSLGNPSLPCRRLFLGGIVHGFCLELLLLLVEFLGNFSSFFLPFWGIKGCVCFYVLSATFQTMVCILYTYIYIDLWNNVRMSLVLPPCNQNTLSCSFALRRAPWATASEPSSGRSPGLGSVLGKRKSGSCTGSGTKGPRDSLAAFASLATYVVHGLWNTIEVAQIVGCERNNSNIACQKSAGGAGLSRPSWEAKDPGESLDDFATWAMNLSTVPRIGKRHVKWETFSSFNFLLL